MIDKNEAILIVAKAKNLRTAIAALDGMLPVPQNVTVKSAQECSVEELQRLEDALLLKAEELVEANRKLAQVREETRAEAKKKADIQFQLGSPMHQPWYIQKKLELTAIQDHEWANKVMLLEGELSKAKELYEASERRVGELLSKLEDMKHEAQVSERSTGQVSDDRDRWARITLEVNALNAIIEERDLTPYELERRNELKDILRANGQPYRSPKRPARLGK